MGNVQQGVSSNADRIADLENALAHERQRNKDAEWRMKKEQQATVDDLTQRLEDAQDRIDRLSADLKRAYSQKITHRQSTVQQSFL